MNGLLFNNPSLAASVAQVLRAVAHPVRLQIVEMLAEGEMCVGDIVVALGAKHPMTSQQLNMMCDKGVLTRRRDGAKVYYRVADPNVISLLDCIHRNCAPQEGAAHE